MSDLGSPPSYEELSGATEGQNSNVDIARLEDQTAKGGANLQNPERSSHLTNAESSKTSYSGGVTPASAPHYHADPNQGPVAPNGNGRQLYDAMGNETNSIWADRFRRAQDGHLNSVIMRRLCGEDAFNAVFSQNNMVALFILVFFGGVIALVVMALTGKLA